MSVDERLVQRDGPWLVGCCCPNGQRTMVFAQGLGDLAASVLGDLAVSVLGDLEASF